MCYNADSVTLDQPTSDLHEPHHVEKAHVPYADSGQCSSRSAYSSAKSASNIAILCQLYDIILKIKFMVAKGIEHFYWWKSSSVI